MRSASHAVRREWEGDACFVLGGGASLAGLDVARLQGKGRRVIALNYAGLLPPPDPVSGGPLPPARVSGEAISGGHLPPTFKEGPYCPWADVHFWHDDKWLADWIGTPRFDGAAPGLRLTVARPGCSQSGARGKAMAARADGLNVRTIGRDDRAALSIRTDKLAGVCAGSRAINYAWLAGARPIVLLGFDQRPGVWYAADGPERRADVYATRQTPSLRRMAGALEREGAVVLNGYPDSLLDCFPKKPLDEILAALP